MSENRKKKTIAKLAKASIKATKKEIKKLKETRAIIDKLIKEKTKHAKSLQE